MAYTIADLHGQNPVYEQTVMTNANSGNTSESQVSTISLPAIPSHPSEVPNTPMINNTEHDPVQATAQSGSLHESVPTPDEEDKWLRYQYQCFI